MPFVGELAALAAAVSFGVTSVCYTFAGRTIDAVRSIAMSLPIAWGVLALVHRVALGEFFPGDVSPARWFFLGASGILAFVVSSSLMLNAYQWIGPRLTTLIAASTPVLSALLAWLFLGQTLPANAALGIAIVVSGIVWVVAERGGGGGTLRPARDLRRGVAYASAGTAAQAAAFVFAAQGLAGGFAPLSATLVRITVGLGALWLFVAFRRRLRSTVTVFRNSPALFLQLAGAALSGPVLATLLVLIAFQSIPVGIATTLSHTTAIVLIPVGHFVFGEKITGRAILGTAVTIAGVALLFLG
jgi:drug/metabolite transporter (DMT)-like permease